MVRKGIHAGQDLDEALQRARATVTCGSNSPHRLISGFGLRNAYGHLEYACWTRALSEYYIISRRMGSMGEPMAGNIAGLPDIRMLDAGLLWSLMDTSGSRPDDRLRATVEGCNVIR